MDIASVIIGIFILLIGIYFFREAVTMIGWLLASFINTAAWVVRKIRDV